MLITANSAGYRYGVSDHAFYIPAVQRQITPALFPHDAPLIEAQAGLTVVDELIARLSMSTGIGLAGLFFGGYLLTTLLFTAGVVLIGSRLYRSTWTVVAFGLALTLRHRLAGTGVHTFEGYFHPRVMAFAIGMIAVGAFLHGRRAVACVLTVVAVVSHPTTGLWFAVWIGVALAVTSGPTLRWALAGAAGVSVALIWWLWRGPVADHITVMDPAWMAALADKDIVPHRRLDRRDLAGQCDRSNRPRRNLLAGAGPGRYRNPSWASSSAVPRCLWCLLRRCSSSRAGWRWPFRCRRRASGG